MCAQLSERSGVGTVCAFTVNKRSNVARCLAGGKGAAQLPFTRPEAPLAPTPGDADTCAVLISQLRSACSPFLPGLSREGLATRGQGSQQSDLLLSPATWRTARCGLLFCSCFQCSLYSQQPRSRACQAFCFFPSAPSTSGNYRRVAPRNEKRTAFHARRKVW